ncbi:MAG: TIR domain-containing protein [Oscillospiraceae bacterium]|nr:TIR domain-containing protein [Oscillospiraceae bacterium]
MENLHYDVFISYRHGELDGFIAEKLHKMLETYRVPASVAKKLGKKKLARVFRDRDELPTSSNLSDSITDALINSDFLLLICSKRTCQSQWVMREVETFGELHGKDKIITLLIDGEPDESFPEGLRERKIGNEIIFVEPLAADIRASTDGKPLSKTRNKDWDRSLKLLRTEEKLRLLAPILGCAYDTLRRRHRRRLIQKTVACVSAVFAVSLSFGAFSTYQYLQIDKQMQLKLENESYVLAEYSSTALANGDRDGAIRLALDALPENLNKYERPFVPAAALALADALGVYDVADTFKAHRVATLPAAPTKVILSPSEKYTVAVFPFSVAVIVSESGLILHEFSAVNSILADVQFLSTDIIVYSGSDGITAYDIERGTILWQGDHVTSIAVSEDKTRIAAVLTDNAQAVVYTSDGVIVSEISFNGRKMRVPAENLLNPNDRLFALNSDGSRLAISFEDGSLSVFDVSSAFENVVFHPSNAGYFAGGFYKDALFFSTVLLTTPASYEFYIYSPALEEVGKYEAESLITGTVGSDGLYISNGNMVASLNVETGAFSPVLSVGGAIESFSQNGDFLIVSESGGEYRFTDRRTGTSRNYGSDSVNHFSDLGITYALTGSRDSRTIRILKRDTTVNSGFFSYDTNYSFSEVKVNKESSRILFYSYAGFRLYDIDNSLIAALDFPNPLEVLDTQFDKESGNLAVIYNDAFSLYSGTDGSLITEVTNAENVFYAPFGVSVKKDGVLSLCDWYGNVTTDGILDLIFTEVYIDGGEIIGIGKTDDKTFSFAVSDGVNCKVFTIGADFEVTERFTTGVRGHAEVYFMGGYVFISPMHGDAKAYTLDGRFVRAFEENAYMTEVESIGEYIAAGYVSMDGGRYSLILTGENLETKLKIPGFMGQTDSGMLLLNDGTSGLHMRELLNTEMLVNAAK